MIVGIGSDVIQISRIEKAAKKWGDRFLNRVFNQKEILYSQSKKDWAASLAARFAAKEACAKALGTGINKGVNWQHIYVTRERGSAPVITLKGNAKKIADDLKVKRIFVTLSHDNDIAFAVVILEAL